MNKAGILIVTLVSLFSLACGGETATPTPTPSPTPEVPATLVQITAVEGYKFEPAAIELKVGQPYQVQFLNRADRFHRLDIGAWGIQFPAKAGEDSKISDVFIPETPGEYTCIDKLYAARYGMFCKLTVVP